MTWIIHRSDRSVIHNSDSYNEIRVKNCTILLESCEYNTFLPFETEAEAKQCFNYLIEAIKRKDAVINL